MNAVFVDTGGWMACADRADAAHVACMDLSFTDCTSVAVMRELRLTTVITTDRHFSQVGFTVAPALPAPKAHRRRAR